MEQLSLRCEGSPFIHLSALLTPPVCDCRWSHHHSRRISYSLYGSSTDHPLLRLPEIPLALPRRRRSLCWFPLVLRVYILSASSCSACRARSILLLITNLMNARLIAKRAVRRTTTARSPARPKYGTNERTNERTDGRTDERVDERTGIRELMYVCIIIFNRQRKQTSHAHEYQARPKAN